MKKPPTRTYHGGPEVRIGKPARFKSGRGKIRPSGDKSYGHGPVRILMKNGVPQDPKKP